MTNSLYSPSRAKVAMAVAQFLEDAFHDIVRKAIFGLGISTERLAQATGIPSGRLAAVCGGKAEPLPEESQALAAALGLNADALWAVAQGWSPPDGINASPYKVQRFRFAEMDSNGYVVQGGGIRSALLVDPGGRGAELITACKEAGGLDAIVLTHSHFDHIQALLQVLEAFPEAPVLAHKKAFGKLTLPSAARRLELFEGARVRIGEAELVVWEAPGHSEDGLVLRLDNLLFTGDTLFSGSAGRAQAPECYQVLLQSARRVLTLPPDTVILAGHGPISTVGLEAVHNPFLA